jgi:hypothetical protein
LRWHGLCFSASALHFIRCKPCCVPHSAYLKLHMISACSSQLVPIWRMLVAIACLCRVQERPGLDSPRGGGCYSGLTHLAFLPWKSSRSHLVWTLQITDAPCQLLGPRFPLSFRPVYILLTRHRWTTRRQAHRQFADEALRHSAAT